MMSKSLGCNKKMGEARIFTHFGQGLVVLIFYFIYKGYGDMINVKA